MIFLRFDSTNYEKRKDRSTEEAPHGGRRLVARPISAGKEIRSVIVDAMGQNIKNGMKNADN